MSLIARFLHCLGFVVSLSLCAMVARGDTPPTLDEIIDGLDAREKAFFGSKSMFVCYERTKSEDIVATVASGGLLPAEWTLAYCGGKWLSQRRFTRPGITDGITIPAEPKICIAKGRYTVDWDAATQRACIDHFDEGPEICSALYLTRNLALDAPRHILQSTGSSMDIHELRKQYADDAAHPFLPASLRENRSRYHVLSDSETIDGVPCWIVEWPGMDRFHVAVERGFSIPMRTYCWGPGKPPQFAYRNSDYREVKPGLWVPFTQIVDRYASVFAEEKSLWGKVACRTEYKVKEIHFDDVSEGLFDVELPPGTLVFDVIRNFSYIVADKNTSDPFAMPIAQAEDLLQQSSQVLPIWATALLLLALGLLIWRRRNARNPRRT